MRRIGTLALGLLLAGCGASPSPVPPGASSGPVASAVASVVDGTTPSTEVTRSADASAPTEVRLLDDGPLPPGTFRLAGDVLGPTFPAVELTVPGGWHGMGWLVARPAPLSEDDPPSVAVQFWDVAEVYGHPCAWMGSEFDPGPTAADLAAALQEIPMRGASAPIAVTLDGRHGQFVEWSVPDDLVVEGDSQFVDCDETTEGDRDFLSWVGAGEGTRFHQGPGQVDQLWIIDLDGARLVIDAFVMPWATSEEVAEMRAVVASIRFLPAQD